MWAGHTELADLCISYRHNISLAVKAMVPVPGDTGYRLLASPEHVYFVPRQFGPKWCECRMEKHFENHAVLITSCPPFMDVALTEQLQNDSACKVLDPDQIFQEHPSLGLRDVALEAVRFVHKECKVLICGTNETSKARKAYISLLKKKCENVSIATICLTPQYGCQQVFWMKEHFVAELGMSTYQHSRLKLVDDRSTLKWFESDTDIDITYKHGCVEEAQHQEGCQVVKEIVGLRTSSPYKFEVPALLIQWDENEAGYQSGVAQVCKVWAQQNPCGRIILVSDGTRIQTGETTTVRAEEAIYTTVKQLTKKFTGIPVYLLHVTDPRLSGRYGNPPRPGLIAYLQRRHCLNLHASSSVYLHETSDHMKLAENAGMRHIKISRVKQQPSLVTSAGVVSPIPEMLKNLQFTHDPSVVMDTSKPSIPLFDEIEEYSNGCLRSPLGHGRIEYLFAENKDLITSYNSTYSNMATRVGTPGTKFCCIVGKESNQSSASARCLNKSRSSLTSRELPKWMLSKDKGSNSSTSSVDSSAGGSEKVRSTVYVMTDRELVEAAIDLLKQASKTDIVESFQTRQEETVNKHKVNKDEESGATKLEPGSTGNRRGANQMRSKDLLSSNICPKLETPDEFDDVQSIKGETMHAADDSLELKLETSDEVSLNCGQVVKPRQELMHYKTSDSDVTSNDEISARSPRKRKYLTDRTVVRDDSVDDFLEDLMGTTTAKIKTLGAGNNTNTRESDDKPSACQSNKNTIFEKRRKVHLLTDIADENVKVSKHSRSRPSPDLSILDDIF